MSYPKGACPRTIRAINSYNAMKGRCREHHPNYKHYGGRGITICDRWLESFDNFLDDMGLPPSQQHTLDRIDNDGNYEPDNCRWVTVAVQARNRNANHMIQIGKSINTVTDWSRITGVPRSTILKRLSNGWKPEDAILTR